VSDGADPRQIGSYEVLAKLAEGGVGTVYLARKRGPSQFSRLVAIKRLHPQFARDADLVTMFTDEARLGARIHHANVVSILDLGADDDGYYVVMEYVEGSNLGHFHWHATRGDKKMPRAVALRIVLDALSGLHAAHEIEGDDGTIVNLVHRDVSPQNIFLGMDGLARLGDFGIARAEALRDYETRGVPALKGKLEYMAPEQVECKSVDRTTDLFAMGIVLWELLTGRRLFSSKSQVTTIQRVCFDPIPSPRSLDGTVSAELDRICLRALERPMNRRYATAAAFAEELEAASRAGVGIATQREVAACMLAVLGAGAPGSQRTARELGRGEAPAVVPDLAGEVKGKASTYQLPASDPLIKLPVDAPVAADAYPAVAEESSATEPFGALPTLGLGREQVPSATTAHYDERLPPEILEEARLASRQAHGERERERERDEGRGHHAYARDHEPRAAGPPLPPVPFGGPAGPPVASVRGGAAPGQLSAPPLAGQVAAGARSARSVALLVAGAFAGAAVLGAGLWRLAPSRAASRAPAATAVASVASVASEPSGGAAPAVGLAPSVGVEGAGAMTAVGAVTAVAAAPAGAVTAVGAAAAGAVTVAGAAAVGAVTVAGAASAVAATKPPPATTKPPLARPKAQASAPAAAASAPAEVPPASPPLPLDEL
jgi:serine/threonine-protein kinase